MIRNFCKRHANPDIVKKYSRYFKEGFDGYGIEQQLFENQRDEWIAEWQGAMSLKDYLILGDELMKTGKYEEKSFAIAFIESERPNYTKTTFDHLGNWFDYGIDNWATSDVFCMSVLSSFIFDRIITLKELREWTQSKSEWQRRAVPVTLVELDKKKLLLPKEAFYTIVPLMLDDSVNVQKGIGTLLRGLWKRYPDQIEDFLMEWKATCGRPIVQYATEKMDKEYRKKFRRSKIRQ
jgi:3-methyladenine DNA glycosylase AlkD